MANSSGARDLGWTAPVGPADPHRHEKAGSERGPRRHGDKAMVRGTSSLNNVGRRGSGGADQMIVLEIIWSISEDRESLVPSSTISENVSSTTRSVPL